MAQINVSNLIFCYEGSADNIFDGASFTIDTNWKMGFVGRNGKGKTTFLNLLLGKYEYQGVISTSVFMDYFPYSITEKQYQKSCVEFLDELKEDCELWRVICELEELHLNAEVLYRPFETLSHGERTKVLLAILFSRENDFLLIDEPTNHVDEQARETIKEYLRKKKGFLLVSHDRDLLDACIDHVLVLNRNSIEVQNGNFTSWWENKNDLDAFHLAENLKHKKEIVKLKLAAERCRKWADKSENSKIGFDPIKEHDRNIATRSYIGAKTKKMQSKFKQYEHRITKEILEKEGLLRDIENPVDLKILPMHHYKDVLVPARGYGISYDEQMVFDNLDFDLKQGERVFLQGKNGSGKSSIIKGILRRLENEEVSESKCKETGILKIASGLVVSYINQDTSQLKGSIEKFCERNQLDKTLFLSILRQLDLERVQFIKNIEDFSEGQKKKVLIAASLLKPAHLYIWDEPLNYIDVFSRIQIENLILKYKATMLIVEHDVRFREKVATRIIEI